MPTNINKTLELLNFLKAIAFLKKKRLSSYSDTDKILWLADIPRNLPSPWGEACKSAFFADNPKEIPHIWLEVYKKPKPNFPPIPDELKEWVPQEFQTNPEDYIDKTPNELVNILNKRITIITKGTELRSDFAYEESYASLHNIRQEKRLEDYPSIKEVWLKYLKDKWEPWAKDMCYWREIQKVYEQVDFMRRRLEEAEERYEIAMAIGLIQWRDNTGTIIKRHLLTAPAEISQEALRGILTVTPAAIFEKFRIELDMFELQDRPRLEHTDIEERLENLDICAWDNQSVIEILSIVANKINTKSQVHGDIWKPQERIDDTLRIFYAPALILRERRSMSYDELINDFIKAASQETNFQTTPPWDRFVREGEISSNIIKDELMYDHSTQWDEDTRLYFPLPTNEEQRQIAERLRAKPYVLVKGPPGTGKSHTIANLISHLLAKGERVLVTAQAPKALTVLRDLLPADIRNLCVTAFGSSREEQKFMEDSVKAIIEKKNRWPGRLMVENEIAKLEKELCELEAKIADIDRQIREYIEAETYHHHLPGGYNGTAAQIARQIEQEQELYGWFPTLDNDQVQCPLDSDDINFFAEFHTCLNNEREEELKLVIGNFPIPSPARFAQIVENLVKAEAEIQEDIKEDLKDKIDLLTNFDDEKLEKFKISLIQLNNLLAQINFKPSSLELMLKDLLFGQDARWKRLEDVALKLKEKITAALNKIITTQITILDKKVNIAKILADANNRLEHFQSGRRRGWWFFTPKVVRETRYIEKSFLVDGRPPRDVKSLEKLIAYFELGTFVEQFNSIFSSIWPINLEFSIEEIRFVAADICECINQLHQFIKFFREYLSKDLDLVPVSCRMSLLDQNSRARLIKLIELELARRPLEKLLKEIKRLPHESTHSCMFELCQAIESRDASKWKTAWERYEALKIAKDSFLRYQQLLARIQNVCPKLATYLEKSKGNSKEKERLLMLDSAWNWAAARAWIRRVSDSKNYVELNEKRKQFELQKEKKIGQLASLKAWNAFFMRLDDQTEQNLTAWTKAIARIGKGTGKYAYRHRRAARQYLMKCIPKIPAWVMPLHKVWETVEAKPGIFDTIIIDEASQAGIESLILLLLSKRIIVVGDDKQNSPEAVGVLEDDIMRLAKDHLKNFQFWNEFRPDTSLYDHAERAFGNVISLREHFRCVPEIIRFSNELCYTHAPLIPLRQPPPKRLHPLKSLFIKNGFCQGEGQRIINPPEANEIIKKIQECIYDKSYEGKTMGVVVLQGHAQAEYIERKLAEILEPKIREERKLRCGVPSTFQGDQRDVIFLSLVVAPNYHFRALSSLPDQRRFNVAMSRARDQVWLFHSVQLHELSREDLRWQLLNFFYRRTEGMLEVIYEELERLEREIKNRQRKLGEQPEPYESWFEVDVALELLRRKYRIRPQFEVAGYYIDIVIEGQNNRLAIECDGESWHGPDRYDYDMARQRQLERVGWKFLRIRESEFYADRSESISRIQRECENLNILPVDKEGDTIQRLAEEIIHAEVSNPSPEKFERPPEKEKIVDPTQSLIKTDQSLLFNISNFSRKYIPDSCCSDWLKMDVLSLPINIWFALAKWSRNMGIFSKQARKFLYEIGKLRSKGYSLTDKQMSWAKQLFEEAIKKGFDPKKFF